MTAFALAYPWLTFVIVVVGLRGLHLWRAVHSDGRRQGTAGGV
jgi:hypothetical protein